MAKNLTYQFKNPNPNIDNQWIPLWTFNGENNKITLNSSVKINSDNIEGINDLVSVIANAANNPFGKQVSLDNSGYLPQGETGKHFLYMDDQGNVTWTTLEVEVPFNNWNVTYNLVRNNLGNQEETNSILFLNNNSTTDFVLNLDDFLCKGVTINSDSGYSIRPMVRPSSSS